MVIENMWFNIPLIALNIYVCVCLGAFGVLTLRQSAEILEEYRISFHKKRFNAP